MGIYMRRSDLPREFRVFWISRVSNPRDKCGSRIARQEKGEYAEGMTMLADNSPVMNKTKELCEAIAGDSEYKGLLEKVERFLADDAAKLQFQSVQERGEELNQKQQVGLELGDSEVKDFEAARDELMSNAVAKEFLDAQQSLQSVQSAIGKYVGLTLELGRVPADEDLQGGCCNEGG